MKKNLIIPKPQHSEKKLALTLCVTKRFKVSFRLKNGFATHLVFFLEIIKTNSSNLVKFKNDANDDCISALELLDWLLKV